MRKILNVIFIIALMTLLAGCELLKFDNSSIKPESNKINYTTFYLSLTLLSSEQITESIHQYKLIAQNKMNNNLSTELQLKSVLFFALPDSPVHNPFTAKSKLNQLSLANLKEAHLTDVDFAFFNMLKTQLNQQVLLLNELSTEKKALQVIKQAYQLKSNKLQQQLQELQQQIIQLKKIESNINEHGQ